MDFIYFMIILIVTFIKDIENVILTKDVINSFANEKVLSVSDEPSLLQCAQRCRYIDKNSIIDFKDSVCTCVKYETEDGQEQQGTLTGVFVSHKLMKIGKPKKIDGGLSDWKNVDDCTVTCGGGALNQTKTCTNPVPQNGDADCIEEPRRTVACNTQKCPCVRTTDGNCCEFPFIYKDQLHEKCYFHPGFKKYICILSNVFCTIVILTIFSSK